MLFLLAGWWIRRYLRREFGQVTTPQPRLLDVVVGALFAAVVMCWMSWRHDPQFGVLIPATMALWMAVAWWYWARRRSHWLVLAALCAALAVTPSSPDQRWDAGLLLMCAGMALQGLLDHFEMIRLVQPLPEELDGHRV